MSRAARSRLLSVAAAAAMALPVAVAALLAASDVPAPPTAASQPAEPPGRVRSAHRPDGAQSAPYETTEPPAPAGQTAEQATARIRGCLTCHTGIEPMHASPAVKLACVDCHGGDASVDAPAGAAPASPDYAAARDRAHVLPRH